MKLKIIISVLVLIIAILCNCKDKKTTSAEMPIETPANTADLNSTFGFNIFKKLRGIWNGPVSSATMLGGYSEWIVDFRPISENQISAKNELDTLNDIFMSFFISIGDLPAIALQLSEASKSVVLLKLVIDNPYK